MYIEIQTSRIVGEQVATVLAACLAARYDWAVALTVNCALGVELLQRAAREACPSLAGSTTACLVAEANAPGGAHTTDPASTLWQHVCGSVRYIGGRSKLDM